MQNQPGNPVQEQARPEQFAKSVRLLLNIMKKQFGPHEYGQGKLADAVRLDRATMSNWLNGHTANIAGNYYTDIAEKIIKKMCSINTINRGVLA